MVVSSMRDCVDWFPSIGAILALGEVLLSLLLLLRAG